MSEQEGTPRRKHRASRDEEGPEEIELDRGEITEQTPAEAAEADGSTDIQKALETTLRENRERLEVVIGVPLEGRECPRCDATGYLPPGQEGAPELVHPDDLEACDRCNGHGAVLTGSKVPETSTTVCVRCNGTGFRIVTRQQENVTPLVPASAATVGTSGAPVMGWMGPDGVFQPLGTPQAGGG